MRTLDVHEMENVEAGGSIGCAAGIVGGALTFAAVFTLTGGVGAAALWAITWSVTPSLVAIGCYF